MSIHRHTAIRQHTDAINKSAATYRTENHCDDCGHIVAFVLQYRDPRLCDRCKIRARVWQEIAS